MDVDLIIFEDDEDYNEKLKRMEHTIHILTEQLKSAFREITSLRNMICDHVNFFHDTETKSRFHISHVHKVNAHQNPLYSTSSESSDTLPTEAVIIDI